MNRDGDGTLTKDESALLPLPRAVGWQDPAVANWVDWPGKWGLDANAGGPGGSPDSPAGQSRFREPWKATCSERWSDPARSDDCTRAKAPTVLPGKATEPLGAAPASPISAAQEGPPGTEGDSLSSEAPADKDRQGSAPEEPPEGDARPLDTPPDEHPKRGDDDSEVSEVCEPWTGPFVKVAICDPGQLKRAVEEGDLDQDGSVDFEGLHGNDTDGSAPGIAQVLGDPLETGDVVPIKGAVSPDEEVVVRARLGERMVESRFEGLDLPEGGKLKVERRGSDGAAVARVVTPGGEVLEPDDVEDLSETKTPKETRGPSVEPWTRAIALLRARWSLRAGSR